MAKITADTEFPREWKDTQYAFISQPYITGLYVAVNALDRSRNVTQMSIDWKSVDRLLKKLRNDTDVIELVTAKVGQFMDEENLKFINSC